MDQLINALGAFFLGAVYLLSLVALGLVNHDPVVVLFAISAAGIGYLAQVTAGLGKAALVLPLWFLSVALGNLAGLAGILALFP